MFLDDAVGHGEAQPGAAALTFFGRVLGREKRIVDALHVLRRDAGAGVGDAHADQISVGSGDAERPAARHGVFGIEE